MGYIDRVVSPSSIGFSMSTSKINCIREWRANEYRRVGQRFYIDDYRVNSLLEGYILGFF